MTVLSIRTKRILQSPWGGWTKVDKGRETEEWLGEALPQGRGGTFEVEKSDRMWNEGVVSLATNGGRYHREGDRETVLEHVME